MTDNAHSSISDDDDIPDLCKKTFVSISNAVKCMWVFAIVIVIPASIAGIGWSIAIGKEQLQQNVKILSIETKQDELDKKINDKLDILIRRGNQRIGDR